MPMQQVHTTFTFGFNKSKLGAVENTVKRTTAGLKTITERTDAFQQRMGGFFQRARGVIGAYLGFRAVRSITTDYAKAADTIAKFSSGLGINAQKYQQLTHAAQLSGVTVEELQVALPNLAKRAGDAADGSKEAALAFKRAGVELREGGKLKDPIQLLTELADGMKGVDKTGRRTQVLMSLFGRAGKKMGVLLSQGSEGIKKAMAEAEKLGIVLSQKQLKDAENFNDEMLRVKSIMTGIRNTIAGKVLPIINKQLRAFQMWWREGRNAERAMRALKGIAFFTAIVMARIVTAAIIRQVKLFTQGIWAMVRGLNAANAAAAITALKITAIFIAIALIVLLIDDLIAFAQGRDSVIGRLLGDSSLARQLRTALVDMANAAKQAWAEIGPALKQSWEALKPALMELGKAIEPLIGPAFKAGVKGMVFSFQGLAWIIRITGDLIKWQIGIWGAWAKGADVIIKAIKFIVRGLMSMASSASTALAAMNALRGRSQVGTGLTGFKKLHKTAQQIQSKIGVDSQGNPVTPGLFRPAPAFAFANQPRTGPVPDAFALRPANPNTGFRPTLNIAPGALNTTVNASGDPGQIARAVRAEQQRGLKKLLTGASRDIQPPPPGQK